MLGILYYLMPWINQNPDKAKDIAEKWKTSECRDNVTAQKAIKLLRHLLHEEMDLGQEDDLLELFHQEDINPDFC